MKKIVKLLKSGFIYIDFKLLIPILILMIIGILAVTDVSAPEAMDTFSDRFYFVKQQAIWMLIGLVCYFVVSQMNVKIWEKLAIMIFACAVVFLILVLIPQLSIMTLGARRWIRIGFLRFQPSEFAKLALCVYLAKLSATKKNIFAYIVPIAITVGLIMLQPDLGTSIVIILISFTQIFISGFDLRKILLIGLGGLAIVSLLIFTSDYRRERVTSFLNPFSNNDAGSYHVKQVLYSLALGGVSGSGIGQSKQKYLFLPEATTDSIFAIISEETGFVGSFTIIVIYLFITLRMLVRSKEIKNQFLKTLALGIFAWFFGQLFVNLGAISALIPFTGVPLPFISYGGSTLVSMLIAFGIFNSILKYSADYE
jgi:cell division protein FtsW